MVISQSGFGSLASDVLVGVAPEGQPTGFGSVALLVVYLIVIGPLSRCIGRVN